MTGISKLRNYLMINLQCQLIITTIEVSVNWSLSQMNIIYYLLRLILGQATDILEMKNKLLIYECSLIVLLVLGTKYHNDCPTT